jgi:hypothetical protein
LTSGGFGYRWQMLLRELYTLNGGNHHPFLNKYDHGQPTTTGDRALFLQERKVMMQVCKEASTHVEIIYTIPIWRCVPLFAGSPAGRCADRETDESLVNLPAICTGHPHIPLIHIIFCTWISGWLASGSHSGKNEKPCLR